MGFSIYGFLIGLGVVAALSFSEFMLRRRGDDSAGMKSLPAESRLVWESFWWVMLPGLVGARIYHVLGEWEYYAKDFGKVLRIWEGGMGIMGGVIGGIAGLLVFAYFKSKKEERRLDEVFFVLGDVLAMGLLLGQALGRWGNFFNKELYGKATDLSWGIVVPGLEGRYHPLFLYESVLNILLFLVLLLIYGRKEKKGMTLGGYLVGYGLIRMVLDGLRHESFGQGVRVYGLRMGQVMGGVFLILGVLVLVRKDKGA